MKSVSKGALYSCFLLIVVTISSVSFMNDIINDDFLTDKSSFREETPELIKPNLADLITTPFPLFLLPFPDNLEPLTEGIYEAFLSVIKYFDNNYTRRILQTFSDINLQFLVNARATIISNTVRVDFTVKLELFYGGPAVNLLNNLFSTATGSPLLDLIDLIDISGSILLRLEYDLNNKEFKIPKVRGELIINTKLSFDLLEYILLKHPFMPFSILNLYTHFKSFLPLVGENMPEIVEISGNAFLKIKAVINETFSGFLLLMDSNFHAQINDPSDGFSKIFEFHLDLGTKIEFYRNSFGKFKEGWIYLGGLFLIDYWPFNVNWPFTIISEHFASAELKPTPELEILHTPKTTIVDIGTTTSFLIKIRDKIGNPIAGHPFYLYEKYDSDPDWILIGVFPSNYKGEYIYTKSFTREGKYMLKVEIPDTDDFMSTNLIKHLSVKKKQTLIDNIKVNDGLNYISPNHPFHVSAQLFENRTNQLYVLPGKNIFWYAKNRESGNTIDLGSDVTDSTGKTELDYLSGLPVGSYIIYPYFQGDSEFDPVYSDGFILNVQIFEGIQVDDVLFSGDLEGTHIEKLKVVNLSPFTQYVEVFQQGYLDIMSISPTSFYLSPGGSYELYITLTYDFGAYIPYSIDLIFRYDTDKELRTKVYTGVYGHDHMEIEKEDTDIHTFSGTEYIWYVSLTSYQANKADMDWRALDWDLYMLNIFTDVDVLWNGVYIGTAGWSSGGMIHHTDDFFYTQANLDFYQTNEFKIRLYSSQSNVEVRTTRVNLLIGDVTLLPTVEFYDISPSRSFDPLDPHFLLGQDATFDLRFNINSDSSNVHSVYLKNNVRVYLPDGLITTSYGNPYFDIFYNDIGPGETDWYDIEISAIKPGLYTIPGFTATFVMYNFNFEFDVEFSAFQIIVYSLGNMELELNDQEFVINDNHEINLRVSDINDDLVRVNNTYIYAISPSGNNRTMSLVWNETEQLFRGYFKPLEKGQYQLIARIKDPYYLISPVSTQVIVKDKLKFDFKAIQQTGNYSISDWFVSSGQINLSTHAFLESTDALIVPSTVLCSILIVHPDSSELWINDVGGLFDFGLFISVENFKEGQHNVTLFISGTDDWIACRSNFSFYVYSPQLEIILPEPRSVHYTSEISLERIASEGSIYVSINGSSPILLSSKYIDLSAWWGELRLNFSIIDGSGDSIHFVFPIYHIYDNDPPIIELTSHADGVVLPSGTLIEFNVSDLCLDAVKYNWDGNSNITSYTPHNTTLPSGDGVHYLNIYATDRAKNHAYSQFTFTPDDLLPTITLINPSNNSVHKSDTLIDLDIIDVNLDYVEFNWDSTLNTPLTSPYNTYLPSEDYEHILNVYAYDQAGNMKYGKFAFITDDTPIIIILISPENNTVHPSNTPIIITFSEVPTEEYYSWDGGTNSTSLTPLPVGDGKHVLEVWASDEVGNWNYSRYEFTTDDRSILITSPISSTSWKASTSQYIYWSTQGTILNVNIELYENSIFNRTIISSTVNDGEFYWSIPTDLVISSQYQIKIIDATNVNMYAVSDNFEIYYNSIVTTEPDSSSSWKTGTSEYIRWNSYGYISSVNISLYLDQTFVRTITTNIANIDEYLWVIPTDITTSDLYNIRVVDSVDSSVFHFSDYFEIFTNEIVIMSPNNTCSWKIGTSHYIYWSAIGDITNVHIRLYENGIFARNIATNTPNDGEYNWTVPLDVAINTLYQVRIIDTSDSSVYANSEYFEIYYNILEIISPTGTTVWQPGNSFYINWSTTGYVSHVNIELYRLATFESAIIADLPNEGFFIWAIPSGIEEDDYYRIKIIESSDSNVYGFSAPYLAIISMVINVTVPESTTYWDTNRSYNIHWTSPIPAYIPMVNIELYKDDIFERTIVSSLPNALHYSWIVPSDLEDSTQYQIKVIATSDSSIFDYSVYFNISTRTIAVLTPNSSTSWERGTSQSIYWNSTGYIWIVDVMLYKGGSVLYPLITSTPNDGEFLWNIPAHFEHSADFQIMVKEHTDTYVNSISDNFEIYSKSISITTPDSSSVWSNGSSYYIYWDSAGTISTVQITLYKNDVWESNIDLIVLNDGEFYWTIPSDLEPSDQYQIKIIDNLDSNVFDFSDYFEINTELMSITITSPTLIDSWEVDTSHYIYWSSSGLISNVNIELYRDGIHISNITLGTISDGEFYWTIPSIHGISPYYQIKIIDQLDPMVYDFSDYFEIYTKSIIITTPNSSSIWNQGSSYYIHWNSRGSISTVEITLYKNDVWERNINLIVLNDREFYWTIPSDLEPSDQYQIKITDNLDSNIFDFSDYFEIYSKNIEITRPDGYSHWRLGGGYIIYWISSGSISQVNIELYKDNAFERTIVSYASDIGEYIWVIPMDLEASSNYQIKITDSSDSEIFDISEYFEIYTSYITVTLPEETTIWEIGSSHNIYWIYEGDTVNVKIRLYNGDNLVEIITSETPNDGEYYWTIPTAIHPSIFYRIMICDANTENPYDYSEYFEITGFTQEGDPSIPGYNIVIFFSIIIGICNIIVWKIRTKKDY